MAGIGEITSQVGRINPSDLIGLSSPVVEPRAVAALTDAFRQGVVTADEITSRFGAVGKSADKAAVATAGAQTMQAQEVVSPEAQAARAASQQAQTAQAQQVTRRAQFPGTAAYDLLAPGAGVNPPLKPDGTPDTTKENQIGTHLAAWDSTRKAAAEEEKNLIQHVDKATNTVMWIEPGGGPVPPARLAQLRRDANMSFQDYIQKFPGVAASVFPGAGQTTEVESVDSVAPVVVEGVATGAQRARVENRFRGTGSTMSDSDILRTIQSMDEEAAEGVTSPLVEPLSKVSAPANEFGFALGPPPVVESKIKSTAEQDKAKLAMTRFAESNDMQSSLSQSGYDPASIGSWFNSLLPEIIKSGDQKMYDSAKSAWAQGLLRLESGAAISNQEKAWYEKSFFPQVNDPPAVIQSKEKLRHGAEQMVSEIARLGGETPETKVVAERLFQQANALGQVSGAKAGVNSNKVVELPSGKRLQRNASGVYQPYP